MLKQKLIMDLGKQGQGNGLAINRNARQYATAYDNDIKIWRFDDQMFLRSLDGSGYVRDLIYTPDGSRLISSHYWKTIVWDTENFKRLSSYDYRSATLACHPSGNSFALTHLGLCEIDIWGLNVGGVCSITIPTEDTQKSSSICTALSYSRKGDLLASGNKNGVVEIWNIETKDQVYINKYDYPVSCLSFSQKQSILAVGYEDGRIIKHNYLGSKVESSFRLHETEVVNINWLIADTNLIASTSSDGCVLIWDTNNTKLLERKKFKYPVSNIAWDTEQRHFLVADKSVRVFACEFTQDELPLKKTKFSMTANAKSIDLAAIHRAFLDGYSKEDDLKMMLRLELDIKLDLVAGGDNLTLKVFNLIEWAENQGRLKELIVAAYKHNPENNSLRQLVENY